MPFAIIARDKPGSQDLRAALRPSHVAYLTERKDMVLVAGPLLDGDGAPCGGLQIVDTEDSDVAEAFSRNDPFRKAELFASVEIVRWRKAFFDREAHH